MECVAKVVFLLSEGFFLWEARRSWSCWPERRRDLLSMMISCNTRFFSFRGLHSHRRERCFIFLLMTRPPKINCCCEGWACVAVGRELTVCFVRWCYGDTKQVCRVMKQRITTVVRLLLPVFKTIKAIIVVVQCLFVLCCFFFFWLLLAMCALLPRGFPLIPIWACNFSSDVRGMFYLSDMQGYMPRIRGGFEMSGGCGRGREREREKRWCERVYEFFWGVVVVLVVDMSMTGEWTLHQLTKPRGNETASSRRDVMGGAWWEMLMIRRYEGVC